MIETIILRHDKERYGMVVEKVEKLVFKRAFHLYQICGTVKGKMRKPTDLPTKVVNGVYSMMCVI